jgi:hypothetical protein
VALITWPGFGIRSITWTLDRPAQINRSAYTGVRTVAANPWHGKWTAKAQLAPIVGESRVLALRAFLASLRGAVNTFKLPATERSQLSLPAATVQTTAAKGANAMTIAGSYVQPGQMVEVNSQLLQVVTSAPTGANCAITFEPALRAAANAGTAV